MPELPEVETIVRRLSQVLLGKTIHLLEPLHSKSVQGDPSVVAGASIENVDRRAKIILMSLSSSHTLLIHLKMTGQLIYQDQDFRLGGGHPTADWVDTLPSKHTRAIFRLSDGSQLYFNDMRLFGWIRIRPTATIAAEFRQYGPDVIDPIVTAQFLQQAFAKRSVPVKQVIMDNAVVAGVGNIYANDALFLAKVDPRKPARMLTPAETKRIFASLQHVIRLGITLGGATIDHYRHVDGFAGKYQDHVQVYQREGLPCPVCKHAIVRIKQAGRSSFFCPNCQR